MTALMVLLIFVGGLVGGRSGIMVFFVFGLVINAASYWFSDRIAIMMTRSKEVTEDQAPELFAIVRKLTASAQLPMPRIFITPSQQPNAFATGRNPSNAVVAVTEGILSILSKDELEGVLAHELAHVKNRDILIGSIAATVAGAIMMISSIARWGLIFGGMGGRDNDDNGGAIGLLIAIIVAPIAAMLVQMAISRSREFQADASGASIVGNSRPLADALLKLESASKKVPMQISPAAAHMFIVNPLSGRSLAGLFSTHPSTEQRVNRLRKMMPGFFL